VFIVIFGCAGSKSTANVNVLSFKREKCGMRKVEEEIALT
jgi:hypothetical protein